MNAMLWLCLIWFGLAVCSVVHGAISAGLDVVTLRNGDIYNGTAAQERFAMEFPYGAVSAPYGLMAELHLGKGRGSRDRLVTRLGDRFTGRLRQREVTMLRVLDPTIPLATADIADITFAPRHALRINNRAPDTVLTHNGIVFAASIGGRDYLLKSASGIRLVPRKDIHLIDVVSIVDGEDHRARVTTNDGEVFHGQPLLENIRVETRYGESLQIPLVQIATLTFGVNHQGNRPNARFRRRLDPAGLIRDTMRDGTPGPEMIALRGGRFVRGDAAGDADEKPPQQLRLKPFAIGLYEVIFEEYDEFCAATGRSRPDDSDWGRGRRPVVNVSWKDAVAYTDWLSGRTGRRYRLPTDAEWEYAARAGSDTRFWWGDELQAGRANCEGCGTPWDGGKTAPVGRFPPNSFGLHDTAGNVFEWVADCWLGSFTAVPLDGSAVEKPDCVSRVIRGGAWSFPAHEIRSANRWRDFSTRRSDDTGFRLARELE